MIAAWLIVNRDALLTMTGSFSPNNSSRHLAEDRLGWWVGGDGIGYRVGPMENQNMTLIASRITNLSDWSQRDPSAGLLQYFVRVQLHVPGLNLWLSTLCCMSEECQ